MGSDQSSPKNEPRNSRNVSKDEVERALERQRQLYEQRMKELLKNQAASKPQQTTMPSTPGQSGSSLGQSPLGVPVTSQRPAAVTSFESLERQRNPYSYTQTSLSGAIQPTAPVLSSTPRPLYPNLCNENSPLTTGNNNQTARQSPLGNNNQTSRQSPLGNNNQTGRQSPFGNNNQTGRQSRLGNNNQTGRQSPLGNNNQTSRQSPVGNNNDFVFVNSHFTVATPSAPPAPPSPPSSRRCSVSRASSGSETGVNCPTCKNRFGDKIFNCTSGHASCLDCRMQARPCGRCGDRITQMRNISVEEYVSQFKVPCVNQQEGCKLNFKLGEMDNHLKECPFREIQCLLPGGLCRWKGKLSLLAMHFENFHPSHKGDVDTEMSIEVHNMCENKRMQLIKIGNFNFIFHLITSESQNKIYIAVQLLGTKFSAAKWTYEIHIYNKGAPRRKYQYSDKCISNTVLLTDLMKENRCAVIPLSYAKTFINHGAINYRFFIKQEYPEKRETRRDASACRRGRGRGRGGYHKS